MPQRASIFLNLALASISLALTSVMAFTSAPPRYDVIVVGGSNAGLSAALTLGRLLRSVLVLDAGEPCNRFATHSHNFLTQDGVPPSAIAAQAKADVAAYETVDFRSARVLSVHREEGGRFSVGTDDGGSFASRKIVVATGMKDILPNDIPGLKECWGKSVIHCPFCHGYEFRGKRTALMMNAAVAFHMAPLVRTLADTLCIVGSDPSNAEEEHLRLFEANDIPVYKENIIQVKGDLDNGVVRSIVLEGGKELPMDAVYARPAMEQTFPVEDIGLELDENGFIKIDPDTLKTSVEGIVACGDCTTPNRTVSIAVASGTLAARTTVFELGSEDWRSNL